MVVGEKEMLGSSYRSLLLEIPLARAGSLASAVPGQFIEIACGNSSGGRQQGVPFLRRPFSIASLTVETREEHEDIVRIEVIHNVIGPGTAWMAQVDIDSRMSVLGPLGNGFTLPQESVGKSLLVGGGVGIPPLFFLADRLSGLHDHDVIGFAGIRSRSHLEHSIFAGNVSDDDPLQPALVLEPFSRSKTASIIATDDGSFGYSGTVVAALEKFLDANDDWQEATLYTCGPEVMLKAVAQMAARRQMACQVCMEAYMACGFGVCQSCVVPAWIDPESSDRSDHNQHYMRVCDEGPVFDSKKIVWD